MNANNKEEGNKSPPLFYFVDTEGNHLEYDSYLDGGYVILDDGTKIVPSRTICNK